MSIVSPLAAQRVVLEPVSWETYITLVNDTTNRRGRMAYDQGVLEIMSPSRSHEGYKKVIGRLIEVFTEELGIDLESTSSTTFRREDLQKGIEADESYYLERAPLIRGKEELDLTIDPGPDLAIEVDITNTSMPKFGIYAALDVREVWRYESNRLKIYVLDKDGQYAEVQHSSVLPTMPVQQLSKWLDQIGSAGETQIVRSFRKWVIENVAS